MPIYEYECNACGHRLDALQKVDEEHLRQCPACGKAELRRLLSAAGFRLKGTGWYETDFKNAGKKPPAKTKSGSADKASSKGSTPASPKPVSEKK